MPYKVENWHALSHEQYFSKHRFSDICPCAFKRKAKNVLVFKNPPGDKVSVANTWRKRGQLFRNSQSHAYLAAQTKHTASEFISARRSPTKKQLLSVQMAQLIDGKDVAR